MMLVSAQAQAGEDRQNSSSFWRSRASSISATRRRGAARDPADAVGARIKQLEETLGVFLVQRGSRFHRFTP
jgi:hypothetical protein